MLPLRFAERRTLGDDMNTGMLCAVLGTLGASILLTVEVAQMRLDPRYQSFLFERSTVSRRQSLLALTLAGAFLWIATLVVASFTLVSSFRLGAW